HQRGRDVPGELAQVPVVPRRRDAVVDGGDAAGAVPRNTEPVPVRGLRTQLRVQALVDQRVCGGVEQPLERDGAAGVGEPTTHGAPPRTQWWKPLGWAWCGMGASRSSSHWTASRTSRRNSSAMSWLKPLRTTTRRTAR